MTSKMAPSLLAPSPTIVISAQHSEVLLLKTGNEFFPALLSAINQAASEIHLQTYTFSVDDIGKQVLAALKNAAQRGVLVYLVVDGYGSRHAIPLLHKKLHQSGVNLLVYRPEYFWFNWLRLYRARLRRLHQKVAVIDGRIAFIGGINIQDSYQGPHARLDFAVRIEDTSVTELAYMAMRLVCLVSWVNLKRRPPKENRFHRNAAGDFFIRPLLRKWIPSSSPQRAIEWIYRDNLLHRRAIESVYLQSIGQAKQEIVIAMAYFFPNQQFLSALLAASHRGVRIRLLLPGKAEYWIQHRATLALYQNLLQAGIGIYEYQASLLHAKVAIIDNDWAMVGSSNIEPFSLYLSRETNALIRLPEFNQMLRQTLETVIADAKPVTLAQENRQSVWSKWLNRACYRLLVLLAVIGIGSKQRMVGPE